MTDTYDKINHWYGWNGGECPVHPETEVEYVLADGTKDKTSASLMFWDDTPAPAFRIIAFRITKLYVEPRTIKKTVALYRSGLGAFEACDAAIDWSDQGMTMISDEIEVEFTLLPEQDDG